MAGERRARARGKVQSPAAAGLPDQPYAEIVAGGDHGQRRVDQIEVAAQAGAPPRRLSLAGVDPCAQFLRTRAHQGAAAFQFDKPQIETGYSSGHHRRGACDGARGISASRVASSRLEWSPCSHFRSDNMPNNVGTDSVVASANGRRRVQRCDRRDACALLCCDKGKPWIPACAL